MAESKYIKSKNSNKKPNTAPKTEAPAKVTAQKKPITGKYIRTGRTAPKATRTSRFIKDEAASKHQTIFGAMIPPLIFMYIASLYVLAYSSALNVIPQMLFVILTGATFADVLLSHRTIRIRVPDTMMIIFVLYNAFSALYTVSDVEVTQHITTMLQLCVLYFVVRLNARSFADVRIFINAMLVGTVIMCVYTFAFYGIGTVISAISTGGRIGVAINQANGMGMYCAILNVILLYYVVYEKKYYCLIPMPLSLILQLACNSRKGILIACVGILLVFLFGTRKKKFLVLICGGLAFLTLIYVANELKDQNVFFERIASIFSLISDDGGYVDGSLTTRKSMIELGIELFKKNPIIGYGPMQFEYYYWLDYGLRRPPHSTFIQILVGYGIIGFSLFYGTYLFYIKQFFVSLSKRLKYSVLFIALIFMMLINDIGANMLTNKYLFILLGLFASYAELARRTEDEALAENTEAAMPMRRAVQAQ